MNNFFFFNNYIMKFFLMTNKKGDYACFFFHDYNSYKKCFLNLKKDGLIDEDENYILHP